MRSDEAFERVTVTSLAELDALVCRRLTGETPRIYWEDSQTHMQFDSMSEALEALQDPYFRQFAPEAEQEPTVLTEVQEFRQYSSDLNVALDVLEQFSRRREVLQMRREGNRWLATFGEAEPVAAATASIAVCLAALRARGVEVECSFEHEINAPELELPPIEVRSLYSS